MSDAAAIPNITVYTKEGCPWCTEVLSFLNEQGVPYEEREVTSNEEHFNEMAQKSGQTKAPTLEVGGEVLPDSDKEQVAQYLQQQGVITSA